MTYVAIYIFACLAYAVFTRFVFKYPKSFSSPAMSSWLWVLAIGIRIICIIQEPVFSEDVYRYYWDGKSISYNINPYEYSPRDDVYAAIRSGDMFFKHIGHQDLPTIYPAFSEWLFYISYLIGGDNSLNGFIFLLIIFEVLAAICFYQLIRKSKLSIGIFWLYMLHPLIVFETYWSKHFEIVGVALLSLTAVLLLNNKRKWSIFAYGLSISTKIFPALIFPLWLKITSEKSKEMIKTIFPIMFLIMLTYIFLGIKVGSINLFGSFPQFIEHWEFNGFFFTIGNELFQTKQLTKGISLVIGGGILISVLAQKKINFTFGVLILFGCALVLSPTVHPWYLLWVLPFGLLHLDNRFARGMFAWTIIVPIVYVILPEYWANGLWEESQLVWCIEYCVVALGFLFAPKPGQKKK